MNCEAREGVLGQWKRVNSERAFAFFLREKVGEYGFYVFLISLYTKDMPKVFTSKSQKIGESGENIACIYLKSKGFTVIERNYYKLIGEIDIIAKKANILHFIEVKSVSCEKIGQKTLIRPEENFTQEKIRKFKKIINFYLAHKNVTRETLIQIDLLAIYLDKETKKAQIKPFWNIIL